MTNRQKLFVSEYMKDRHAGNAAIRAGYSPNTASQIIVEVMKKPEIKEAIDKRMEKLCEKAEVSREFIIAGLKEVATRCLNGKPKLVYNKETKEFDILTDENGNIIYEFDSGGANRSLELLGKTKQLFVDKTVTETVDIPLEAYLKRCEDENEY